MRFPPSLLDEIRARLPVSQVVARRVPLKRAGREYKGLSPFKQERTPSFTVNDQKGFYHCFASGEHGDIFDFLIKTEGLSFAEAVERLAAEAGVALPRRSAELAEVADRRQRLQAAVEAAAAFYEAALRRPEGRAALRYVEGRALSRDTIARFRIGYAPGGRAALKDHLARQNFTHDEMVEAGLLVAGADIPVSYDRFRNRLMFPITDLKDRVIAFGGRTLDTDGQPKYLNSPETPLFHKGALLYNAAKARAAAHAKGRVIAVEGYMDAIALAQAGFDETVAPLGTALTPEQLTLLWRLAPEPTLCFDGDAAGKRAAYRAVETALAHLAPGRSLKFAFLPDGLDPDDLVRQEGPEALERVLAQRTRPLFDVLIEREEAIAEHLSTPEQRAALEVRLKALIATIPDATVRAHYQQELKGILWARSRQIVAELTVGARTGAARHARRDNTQADWRVRERALAAGRPQFRAASGRGPQPSAVASNALQASLASHAPPSREALLVRVLLNHPWLIEEHAEDIAGLQLESRPLAALRDGILATQASHNALDRLQLRDQLERLGFGDALLLLDRSLTHASDKFAGSDASPDDVSTGWSHLLALHRSQRELRSEIAAAERSWFEEGTEAVFARLCDLNRRLHEVEQRDGGNSEP